MQDLSQPRKRCGPSQGCRGRQKSMSASGLIKTEIVSGVTGYLAYNEFPSVSDQQGHKPQCSVVEDNCPEA